jgi:hypothetical protein
MMVSAKSTVPRACVDVAGRVCIVRLLVRTLQC